ncbi:dipeptidyl carboxypeptidase II [Odoribacter laneus]|uniref:M3 family metallopeptidase n=1 Tax=Odoribacter laneus TaxID=626933 RepID=UPI00189AC96E|nr:M3 family metallopeptidase [Odoribacter laneus]GKI20921.1 dipeptidyl carboxypeptidase II [Odoribacter laneus]GKI24185.1 dipeptidyl carboxypeptidase II [Odoribacter laneus]
MNKKIYMAAFLLMSVSCSKQEKNPLLEDFNTPHATPPFEQIQTKDYLPAFDQAIAAAQQEIQSLANSSDEPDFENTIVALDAAGEKLNTISAIFFNLNSAHTNAEMQKIAQEVSPKLTEFGNSIYMNPQLFKRVKYVYDKREQLSLLPEQSTLLDKTWKSFVNGGANLEGDAKERFKEISIELSKLSLQFEENVLAETNDFELHLTAEEDLSGLPEGVREAAALSAKENGKTGWIFTLHAPSYGPFMKYADNRELREKMYRAYNSRGNHDNAHNNSEIIRQITALRLEKAKIMGYETFADYVLTNRMAESPAEVNDFLAQLLQASHPFALQEKKEVEDFARSLDFKEELQRWDWSYYSNKLKQEKYALDDEMLKPYFKLENVQKGIFDLAHTLYGLQFKEVNNIPKYHPDVKTFEVYDRDNSFLAVLYVDFFPRPSKSGGAWMTEYQTQHIRNGEDIRPQVSLVMNFTRPTENKPSLLSFDEVTTFLHEFGHSLHGMLSQNTYNATAGTSVYRDFVELPSQIMENWALEKEWLDTWAVHYQTGEKIPAEYIEKIRRAANFQSGYLSDRQLSFGIIDMDWHSITQPLKDSIVDFERKAMQPTEIFPAVEGTCFSTAFGHIFGGGYAAGYYSYKWAEVLDADAFSAFQENGIFDPVTAESFRKNILEKGGSEHPMTLYVRFRGHKPTIDALLKRSGLR